MEFLDFQVISRAVPFQIVLDHLNIPYKVEDKEIRGQNFVINTEKNLYFNPSGKDRGSVINFWANFKKTDLRSAAHEINKEFLPTPADIEKQEVKKIPEYTLQYSHPFLHEKGIMPELAEEFEMGYYGQRGIMSGKIAIKIRDAEGNKVAYIGRNIKENKNGKYFYFKGYRPEHVYNLHRFKDEKSCILVVSPFEVVRLHKEGQKAVALLNHSMSKEQEELLRRFEAITILHPKPDNIIQRLSRFAFVKAPEIS
jgi:hypothetical protein